jgi:hypothetical protein
MIDKPSDHTAESIDGDKDLLRELASLPKAIQPGHDQWQQISQRIAAEESSRSSVLQPNRYFAGKGWLALAASVLLVAISSFFLMQSSGIQAPSHQPVATVEDQHPAWAATTARWPTSSVEREYQAAFREFVRLDRSQTTVPGKVRAAMVQDWELMQQLEQDLLSALELEPENPLLLDRWMHLRARQLQLLHVIAETGQSPGRTLI